MDFEKFPAKHRDGMSTVLHDRICWHIGRLFNAADFGAPQEVHGYILKDAFEQQLEAKHFPTYVQKFGVMAGGCYLFRPGDTDVRVEIEWWYREYMDDLYFWTIKIFQVDPRTSGSIVQAAQQGIVTFGASNMDDLPIKPRSAPHLPRTCDLSENGFVLAMTQVHCFQLMLLYRASTRLLPFIRDHFVGDRARLSRKLEEDVCPAILSIRDDIDNLFGMTSSANPRLTRSLLDLMDLPSFFYYVYQNARDVKMTCKLAKMSTTAPAILIGCRTINLKMCDWQICFHDSGSRQTTKAQSGFDFDFASPPIGTAGLPKFRRNVIEMQNIFFELLQDYDQATLRKSPVPTKKRGGPSLHGHGLHLSSPDDTALDHQADPSPRGSIRDHSLRRSALRFVDHRIFVADRHSVHDLAGMSPALHDRICWHFDRLFIAADYGAPHGVDGSVLKEALRKKLEAKHFSTYREKFGVVSGACYVYRPGHFDKRAEIEWWCSEQYADVYFWHIKTSKMSPKNSLPSMEVAREGFVAFNTPDIELIPTQQVSSPHLPQTCELNEGEFALVMTQVHRFLSELQHRWSSRFNAIIRDHFVGDTVPFSRKLEEDICTEISAISVDIEKLFNLTDSNKLKLTKTLLDKLDLPSFFHHIYQNAGDIKLQCKLAKKHTDAPALMIECETVSLEKCTWQISFVNDESHETVKAQSSFDFSFALPTERIYHLPSNHTNPITVEDISLAFSQAYTQGTMRNPPTKKRHRASLPGHDVHSSSHHHTESEQYQADSSHRLGTRGLHLRHPARIIKKSRVLNTDYDVGDDPDGMSAKLHERICWYFGILFVPADMGAPEGFDGSVLQDAVKQQLEAKHFSTYMKNFGVVSGACYLFQPDLFHVRAQIEWWCSDINRYCWRIQLYADNLCREQRGIVSLKVTQTTNFKPIKLTPAHLPRTCTLIESGFAISMTQVSRFTLTRKTSSRLAQSGYYADCICDHFKGETLSWSRKLEEDICTCLLATPAASALNLPSHFNQELIRCFVELTRLPSFFYLVNQLVDDMQFKYVLTKKFQTAPALILEFGTEHLTTCQWKICLLDAAAHEIEVAVNSFIFSSEVSRCPSLARVRTKTYSFSIDGIVLSLLQTCRDGTLTSPNLTSTSHAPQQVLSSKRHFPCSHESSSHGFQHGPASDPDIPSLDVSLHDISCEDPPSFDLPPLDHLAYDFPTHETPDFDLSTYDFPIDDFSSHDLSTHELQSTLREDFFSEDHPTKHSDTPFSWT